MLRPCLRNLKARQICTHLNSEAPRNAEQLQLPSAVDIDCIVSRGTKNRYGMNSVQTLIPFGHAELRSNHALNNECARHSKAL